MFKRIEKRIRKREKEEELGLDGEMREMLGINDTDSDESSSSGSEAEEGDGSGEETRPRAKILGDASDTDADEDERDVDAEEEIEADSADEDDDEDKDEEPPMSLSEALQNPLYLISLEPETKACVVCPVKLLKNPVMIEVHLKSNAHRRRFARLREAAMGVDAGTDVRELVRALFANPTTEKEKRAEGKLSKRAEKKKAKLAVIKAKRAKQKLMKAKYRAKKEARLKASSDASSDSDNESARSPASKKRKVEEVTSTDNPPHAVAKRLKQTKFKSAEPSKEPELPSRDKPKKSERRSTNEKPFAKAISKPALSPAKSARGSITKAKKRRRSEPAA